MKKKKVSITQVSRLSIQIAFFVFLPALYINTFAGVKQIYLAIIHQSFDFVQLAPQLVEAVVIIPVTILMGRFFCGWMCAFGAYGDFVYNISKKLIKSKFRMIEKLDAALKYFKYALLAFLVFYLCTFNIITFSSFNPWDAFGMLATVGKAPDFSFVAVNLTVGFILFILITAASMFVERFFCRYLCPLGAVFALTSKARIAKIEKERSKCGNCRICTNNCAMGIPLYKTDTVTSIECINCMKCVTACPRKNVTLSVDGDDVRPLVAGAAVVTVMTGLYYAVNLGINVLGLNNVQTVTQSSQSQTGSSVTGSSANSTSSDTAGNVQQAGSKSQTQAPADSSEGSSSTGTKYKDGTYEGSGTGFRGGTTTVSVTVKDGKVTDIFTLSDQDTPRFYNRTFGTIIQEIIDSQNASVDTVSGATYSSRGIMAAVNDALSKAV